jgi:hypothetical protein
MGEIPAFAGICLDHSSFPKYIKMSKSTTSFITWFRLAIPAKAGISLLTKKNVIPAKAGTSRLLT